MFHSVGLNSEKIEIPSWVELVKSSFVRLNIQMDCEVLIFLLLVFGSNAGLVFSFCLFFVTEPE